ncbi:MAG: Nif3-like dinuclear metal center hexameric protein [Candidatus Hydrogenedentes bacterium]|nr:Nif3-like dinuclear metal center hexameric protein [Candidatus Hydrogenedentota bacterium]
MKVRDVIEALDAWAPPALAYSWDRPGLSTGAPDESVSKVLVALTATRAAFNAARKARAGMIVAHHPLIWEPLTTLRSDDPAARLLLDIAEAGMASYSVHTNLDVVPQGVNHALADRLGLVNVSALFQPAHARQVKLVTFVPDSHVDVVRGAVCGAGGGVIGEYSHCSFSAPGTGTFLPSAQTKPFSGAKGRVNKESERRLEILVPGSRLDAALAALNESHPYDEAAYDIVSLENIDPEISLGLRGTLRKPMKLDAFAEHVRAALRIAHVRVVGPAAKPIESVAIMGGAGCGSTPQVPGDIDAYVTGDIKYHEAVDANERGLALIDAGHHGTERWIVPALAKFLRASVKGLCAVAYMEPDPYRIVAG